MEDNKNAAKVVTSAMLGLDMETVLVGGKVYVISAPTIKTISGVGYYLSRFGNEETIGDFMRECVDMMDACKALSWFIQGDEGLADELANGTFDEVVAALETGVNMLGTRNFLMLSSLSRNVSGVIANQRR